MNIDAQWKKMSKTLFSLLLTLFFLAQASPAFATSAILDHENILRDESIHDAFGTYSRELSDDRSLVGPDAGYDIYRTYIEFDTSEIPDGATINSIEAHLTVSYPFHNSELIDIQQMDYTVSHWSSSEWDDAGNEALYNYITNETTKYVNDSSAFQTTGAKSFALGAPAVTDMQNQLGNNWFGIVIKDELETGDEAASFYCTEWTDESVMSYLVVDYTEAAPTPTPTPTSSPGSTDSSNSGSSSIASAPSCVDTKPASAPDLFQIDVTDTSARLFFTPISNTSTYFISCSTSPLAEEHGIEVDLYSNGVQSFSVNLLNPNTTYFFKVRGQNGCMPGNWSNILQAKIQNIKNTQTRSYYKNSATTPPAPFSKKNDTGILLFTTAAPSSTILPQPTLTPLPDKTMETPIPIPTPPKRCFLFWCW